MAFYCGPGLRELVAARAGELAFVEPHAVHAEHNPESVGANTAIVARDTQGPSMFPCDVPDETPGGKTGIHVVPPPVAGGALSTVAAAEALAAVAPYRLQTRRIALDRITLAPGAAFSSDTRAVGETAVTVLRGAARIQDRDAGQLSTAPRGRGGSSRLLWSVENSAAGRRPSYCSCAAYHRRSTSSSSQRRNLSSARNSSAMLEAAMLRLRGSSSALRGLLLGGARSWPWAAASLQPRPLPGRFREPPRTRVPVASWWSTPRPTSGMRRLPSPRSTSSTRTSRSLWCGTSLAVGRCSSACSRS